MTKKNRAFDDEWEDQSEYKKGNSKKDDRDKERQEKRDKKKADKHKHLDER